MLVAEPSLLYAKLMLRDAMLLTLGRLRGQPTCVRQCTPRTLLVVNATESEMWCPILPDKSVNIHLPWDRYEGIMADRTTWIIRLPIVAQYGLDYQSSNRAHCVAEHVAKSCYKICQYSWDQFLWANFVTPRSWTRRSDSDAVMTTRVLLHSA